MALEDAWALGALVASGDEGLARYEALRRPRAAKVIAAAEKNAWRYHLRPGPLRMAAHLGLRVASGMVPGLMVGAFDWLYGYDVVSDVKKHA